MGWSELKCLLDRTHRNGLISSSLHFETLIIKENFFFCFKRAIVIVEMVELDYSIPSLFIGR